MTSNMLCRKMTKSSANAHNEKGRRGSDDKSNRRTGSKAIAKRIPEAGPPCMMPVETGIVLYFLPAKVMMSSLLRYRDLRTMSRGGGTPARLRTANSQTLDRLGKARIRSPEKNPELKPPVISVMRHRSMSSRRLSVPVLPCKFPRWAGDKTCRNIRTRQIIANASMSLVNVLDRAMGLVSARLRVVAISSEG